MSVAPQLLPTGLENRLSALEAEVRALAQSSLAQSARIDDTAELLRGTGQQEMDHEGQSVDEREGSARPEGPGSFSVPRGVRPGVWMGHGALLAGRDAGARPARAMRARGHCP